MQWLSRARAHQVLLEELDRRMRRRIRVTRVIFFSSMTTLLLPPRARTLGPAACARAAGACLRRSTVPYDGLPLPQMHRPTTSLFLSEV